MRHQSSGVSLTYPESLSLLALPRDLSRVEGCLTARLSCLQAEQSILLPTTRLRLNLGPGSSELV